MKIMIFYSGYLPGIKYGGPVSSLFNLTELLGDECELYLVCTNHDLHDRTPYTEIVDGWNKVGKVKVMYLPDKEMTFQRYDRIISEAKPDLLYSSSIFSATHNYWLYGLSRKWNIPIMLAPRGELNSTALKNNFLKKKIYLMFLKWTGKLRNVVFQATSQQEYRDIVANLGISEERVTLLSNVPAIPHDKIVCAKKTGSATFCFVGRIVKNKNVKKCILAAKGVKANITLDIFGPIEDEDYWNECKKEMASCPSNVEINYKGVVSQLCMRNLYSQYDCLISPTEFENFGQAIVEALANSTPVIISKNTTPWDDVNEWNAGFVHSISQITEFTASMDRVANMTLDEYQKLTFNVWKYYQHKFNIEQLRLNYISVFSSMTVK